MKKIFLTPLLVVFGLFSGFEATAQSQNQKWTLEACVQYALAHNISIKQSDLDSQSAAVEKKAALGNFLPTVNVSGTHSWNVGLNQNITTGILENQTTQNTSVGLNSGITIYNGMQNQNRLRRANLSVLAAQFQSLKMKDDVALNVANAYLQILFNKENLKVQKEQLANNQKQLQRSTALVAAGSVPRGDLLDIKATVASNEQNVVLAENNLLISKLSLAQLLQLDDFQNFDTADDIPTSLTESEILIQDPKNIVQKAKENRVEPKIATTNFEIAQKDLLIAKGALQPRVSGFYSFTTRAGYSDRVVGVVPNLANPTTPIGYVEGTNQAVLQPNFLPVTGKAAPILTQFDDYKGHSVALQLSIPVFNGFSAKNNITRAKIALERTKIAQEQTAIDLERNVYTAYTNAKGALNANKAAQTTLLARQEAYNYAQEKYAVGMMNAFDFNQSQTVLANAQSEVLRTKYDYIFKLKIIELYFGIPIIKN